MCPSAASSIPKLSASDPWPIGYLHYAFITDRQGDMLEPRRWRHYQTVGPGHGVHHQSG